MIDAGNVLDVQETDSVLSNEQFAEATNKKLRKRLYDRENKRNWRNRLTEEEKELKRVQHREWKRKYRSQLNDDARVKKRLADREYKRKSRSLLSEEEKGQRRIADRERKRQARLKSKNVQEPLPMDLQIQDVALPNL